MLSRGIEQAAEIDEAFSIEPKGSDRGAAIGRAPNHQREVAAPDKVIAPSLAPWMEQSYRPSGDRIVGFGLGVLVPVAALTSESEIAERMIASLGQRNDVLDRKRLDCKAQRGSTVFARAASAGQDGLSRALPDAPRRHSTGGDSMPSSSMSSDRVVPRIRARSIRWRTRSACHFSTSSVSSKSSVCSDALSVSARRFATSSR